MRLLRLRSLQSRLLLGIFVCVTGILTAGGVVVYHVVDSYLREETDRMLMDRALFYRETISLTKKGKFSFKMGEADWERATEKRHPDYLEFWFVARNRLCFRSQNLNNVPLPRPAVRPGEFHFEFLSLPDGSPGRLVTHVFEVKSQEYTGPPVMVQAVVAQSLSGLLDALRDVRWFLVKTAGALVVAIMAAARYIIRRGLKPVNDLASQIDKMPLVDNGQRFGLPGSPATELEPVVRRLNALMDRVSAAIEHERQFASNAAHELRNPLAAIRSQTEAALSRTRSIEEYEETLEQILESQAGLQRVVDHLLLLARLESGHQSSEFAREPVLFPKLLRKAWRPCFETAEQRRLKVSWQVEDPGRELVMAPALVEIVLRNLFDNTVSYTPEGGSVRISAAVHGNECRLSVANTNPGLKPEELEEVFTPFWRANPNASGHRGNAGIGMALVRRVMDTLEGSITAALEDGTVVFKVVFPVAAAPRPARAGTAG